MKNTNKRILSSIAMLAAFGAAAWLGATRWLAAALALGMSAELLAAVKKSKKKVPFLIGAAGAAYGAALLASAYFLGAKPAIMLLLLMTIAAADIGAWYFGRTFGGDKLWPRISPNKTWTGQIAGIICGTAASVMYSLLAADIFMSALMWIGIGVSLLSQYGDLAMSAVKRRLGIKDFSNILPGHGGLLDRFDGWIFALPTAWLATL
ncbi:MAG: phosphatidate cytidylyltransferase [Rickettsiales bacterium]|nr:phosphatidate cytidylyltransferase [Rickettsiales bacterium]